MAGNKNSVGEYYYTLGTISLFRCAPQPQVSLVVLRRKEKQVWAIRVKGIKAKENNRKRPSLVQRKNED